MNDEQEVQDGPGNEEQELGDLENSAAEMMDDPESDEFLGMDW